MWGETATLEIESRDPYTCIGIPVRLACIHSAVRGLVVAFCLLVFHALRQPQFAAYTQFGHGGCSIFSSLVVIGTKLNFQGH